MVSFFKKIRRKIKIHILRFGCRKRNDLLKYKDITIISNNCWGGLCYKYLNLPFFSPTIGLYFFAEDYLKFVSNFEKYINTPLTFIETSESTHYEALLKKKEKDVIVGILEDVEIVFLHYKNKEKALEKWDRRRKKINYDKLIFKFSEQNECTYKMLCEFDGLPLPNKIMFTSKKYSEFNCNIYMEKYEQNDEVKNDAFLFSKYIDMVDYINNMNIEVV